MKKTYSTPLTDVQTVTPVMLMAGSVASDVGIEYGGSDLDGTRDPASRGLENLWY